MALGNRQTELKKLLAAAPRRSEERAKLEMEMADVTHELSEVMMHHLGMRRQHRRQFKGKHAECVSRRPTNRRSRRCTVDSQSFEESFEGVAAIATGTRQMSVRSVRRAAGGCVGWLGGWCGWQDRRA